MRAIFRIVAVASAWVCFGSAFCKAADPLAAAVDGFRKERAKAMVKENELFLHSLQQSLTQAQLHKETLLSTRLESMIKQLQKENATLLKQGDLRALAPVTAEQLRLMLIGTGWSVSKKPSEARVFLENGQFKSKISSIQYTVVNSRRVSIVWSPKMRIDCDFNEDFTEMKELGGEGNVWHWVP